MVTGNDGDCYFCNPIENECMKFLIRILFLLAPLAVLGQNPDLQNMPALASRYYQNKEFAKAAELYQQIFASTKSQSYFSIYLDCLLAIPDYERAEKEIRKGIRGTGDDAYWYIQWGFLKKAMGQPEEAGKMYTKALSSVSNNPVDAQNLANQFINRREYEYAEKVYLQLRGKGNTAPFNYELARVYYYMRNYDKMLNEYMEWAKLKDGNLEIVKANLQSILSIDNDNEISGQMRNFLLKRIQADPNEITYNRLLIWLLIQEKNFPAAIRQAVALDKRTGQEEGNIFGLANIASSNKDYDDAAKAYDYLVSKGKNADYYYPAVQQQVHMQYNRFAEEDPMNMEKARALQDKFDQTLKLLGTNAETSLLISEYAHLLAFYLNKAEDAINLLNEAIALPQLKQEQLAILKTELSDVNVYAGNLWDAVLTYSQVIESNKNNSLGDDVKFKKAKLGYYMGNFQWAKAQLDALRASTSKLIANDAMELSLFINENMDDDSTAAPLRIFARADLQMFRNNFAGTLAALDSITKLYPYNSLEDDVNFRKAAILQKQGKYAEAAEILESIVTNNGSDMLADDALFQLAEIYRNHLNQKDKATECYKKMLTDYPGSIYVVDSRTEYRKLQDSMKTDAKPDSEKTKEDLFFEGKSPNP